MTPQPPPHIGQAEGDFTGDETWLATLDETGARQHPFDITTPAPALTPQTGKG